MSSPGRPELSPKNRPAYIPSELGCEIEQDPPVFTYNTHVSQSGQIPRIHHCYTKEHWEVALNHLLHERVLGFDCEWKPNDIYPETVLTPEKGRVFDELRGSSMVMGQGAIWLPNAVSRSGSPGDFLPYGSQLIDRDISSLQQEVEERNIIIPSEKRNTIEDINGHAMRVIKEKCSVVQLSSENHIVVAHVARFPTSSDKPSQLVPEILRYILGCPKIIKSGLEVIQDGNLCDTQLGVKVHGLRCLRVLHDALSDKKFKGMGGLAALYLQKRMTGKGDQQRQLSDWSLPEPLTEQQIEYAGNDALISLLIHDKILEQLLLRKTSDILRILQGDMSSSSPSLIQPTSIPPHLKSLRAKLTREKRHRANFLTLDTSSKILYGNLRSLRDELMHEAGLFDSTQSRFVADTETIFLLAREKPFSLEALQGLGKKVQKATRKEYCYRFLNEVRRHLGESEVLVEPESLRADREQRLEERKLKMKELRVKNHEIMAENTRMIEKWEFCDPRRARRWIRLNKEPARRYGFTSEKGRI